jgi:predicted secreted protein
MFSRSGSRVLGLLVFLLVFLLVCVLFETSAKTLLLNETDDNSHICLNVGDLVSIKLVSNPTTGYSWGKPENIAHLKLLSTQSEKDSTDRVGAAGFQVFSLKATEVGESKVVLSYARPFEKNTPAAKTFHLSITIEARPGGKTEPTVKP